MSNYYRKQFEISLYNEAILVYMHKDALINYHVNKTIASYFSRTWKYVSIISNIIFEDQCNCIIKTIQMEDVVA